MFVNRTELKVQLIRNDMNQSDLAKKLNISRQMLSSRMKNKQEFKENEIQLLAEMFGSKVFFL